MTTKDEALKLALEALELHLAHHEHGCVYLDPALTAIKEALAQPEQYTDIVSDGGLDPRNKFDAQPAQKPFGWLYSLIVESQVVNQKFSNVNWDTKHEPFGRHGVDHGGKVTKMPLYNTPPKRKPLTHEQRLDVMAEFEKHRMKWDDISILIDLIEAAHGIKE